MTSSCMENDILRFHRTFFLFDKSDPLIFQMCFMRSTIIANLCPNMTIFYVVDFSERSSEKSDKFLLTLSDTSLDHEDHLVIIAYVHMSRHFGWLF